MPHRPRRLGLTGDPWCNRVATAIGTPGVHYSPRPFPIMHYSPQPSPTLQNPRALPPLKWDAASAKTKFSPLHHQSAPEDIHAVNSASDKAFSLARGLQVDRGSGVRHLVVCSLVEQSMRHWLQGLPSSQRHP